MSRWQISFAEPTVAALEVNIIFLLLGLYGWEYIQSLDVEYAVIRGRLSFRWPLIPYITGRTCLLVFLILLAIGASPTPVNIFCLPSTLMTAITGDIAVGCSSTIFVIRTWMIWKTSRLVRALLLVLSLGQWTMLAIDVANVRMIDVNGVCEAYINYPQLDGASLIYTTCYDLLVFVLLVVGLSRQRPESPLKKCLLTQGILYVVVTAIAYIPPMVAIMLKNSLALMFANFAITISTISASRAVRSLLFLDTSNPDQTPENNIALTTQIAIHPSITRDSMSQGGRFCVDETDKC